MSAAE